MTDPERERERCRELEETLREAVRLIAPRENRQATREGQDFLIRARRVLVTDDPSPSDE